MQWQIPVGGSGHVFKSTYHQKRGSYLQVAVADVDESDESGTRLHHHRHRGHAHQAPRYCHSRGQWPRPLVDRCPVLLLGVIFSQLREGNAPSYDCPSRSYLLVLMNNFAECSKVTKPSFVGLYYVCVLVCLCVCVVCGVVRVVCVWVLCVFVWCVCSVCVLHMCVLCVCCVCVVCVLCVFCVCVLCVCCVCVVCVCCVCVCVHLMRWFKHCLRHL